MFKPAPALWVDANQEQRLKSLVASGKTPQKIVLRARIILLAGAGVPNHAIAARVGASRLAGPVRAGTGALRCVASYDGSFAPVDAACAPVP